MSLSCYTKNERRLVWLKRFLCECIIISTPLVVSRTLSPRDTEDKGKSPKRPRGFWPLSLPGSSPAQTEVKCVRVERTYLLLLTTPKEQLLIRRFSILCQYFLDFGKLYKLRVFKVMVVSYHSVVLNLKLFNNNLINYWLYLKLT